MIFKACVESNKGGKLTDASLAPRNRRDCTFAEGSTCSAVMPCTPCNPIEGTSKAVLLKMAVFIQKGTHAPPAMIFKRWAWGRCARVMSVQWPQMMMLRMGSLTYRVNGKIIQNANIPLSSTVAPWDVVSVKPCRLCCESNRTKTFFDSHGIAYRSPAAGQSNISVLFDAMQALLEMDPAYFITDADEDLNATNTTL